MTLHEESLYLQGARDVLMRLREDYDMKLTPAIKCKALPINTSNPPYCWFPLSNGKVKTCLGEAMYNCLLYDRESLVRFLEGQSVINIISAEKDKKNNLSRLTIEINGF